MKKLILLLPVVIVFALIALSSLAGITPAFIIYGPGVGSGIGSKLLCSAEYVMHQDREQAFADLVQYSPILNELTIQYEPESRSVSTSLFGLAPCCPGPLTVPARRIMTPGPLPCRPGRGGGRR